VTASISRAEDIDRSDKPIVFGAHYGYVFDVQVEKNRRDIEMVMLPKYSDNSKPLKDVIFNEKLSKEFQQQYEYRFGQTSAEQVMNSPVRNDDYIYYNSQTVTIQEYQKQQRKFAEYMTRRLTEFHVDHWAKSDPDLRPIYAVKDKISSVNVETKSGYKFKWKYNFSGPNMEFKLENPYKIETKVRIEMRGIASEPDEVIYSLAYPVSARMSAAALYREHDGLYQLVLSRRMTSSISTSITGSMDTLPFGPVVQQNLILVGLSWSD
jgi:hypothetical protein